MLKANRILVAALLFLATNDAAQSVHRNGDLPRFMGRAVTITEPEYDSDGSPKGPARVCLEGPPQRQCYTAPKDFGIDPTVTVVHLEKNMPAILFTAAGGGVSGWPVHLALLRPGEGNDLQDLFRSDTSVSNQSQHTFWSDLSISPALIFVTADYVWGPDEGPHGEHRYIISAYIRKRSSPPDGSYYYLQDRYMTARKYDLEGPADILGSEKQGALARVRRLKAGTNQH